MRFRLPARITRSVKRHSRRPSSHSATRMLRSRGLPGWLRGYGQRRDLPVLSIGSRLPLRPMFGAGLASVPIFQKTPQARVEGTPADKPIRSAGIMPRPPLADTGRHPPADQTMETLCH